ncbi:hypothetical protein PYW07_008815 [Mythimna separata]|uniref:FP protein C-terminal domain-containing protein n=1 Tax=Mythimna separata TaxID=271217 RepID=A0AAD7YAR3_MYTSE|nr:hypothetical protein PYW07_008815 [Mythimna separata]
MSVKRTPPKNTTNIEPALPFSSEPNTSGPLEMSRQSTKTAGVTFRNNKRKFEAEFSAELKTFKEDITSMFAELKKEQNEKFHKLQSNLEELKSLNTELRTDLQFYSEKYDELLKNIHCMEVEAQNSHEYVRSLENKVEYLERCTKSASIEIRNLPKNQRETKQDLVEILKTIGDSMSTPITVADIRDIYRLTSKSPEIRGTVVVDFNSVLTKENLMNNVKNYNKTNAGNKLNSSHIHLPGKTPIYLAECLTTKAKKVFYQAREFAKLYKYAYCWSAHGNIYIRRKEGETASKIVDEHDLEKLKLKQTI